MSLSDAVNGVKSRLSFVSVIALHMASLQWKAEQPLLRYNNWDLSHCPTSLTLKLIQADVGGAAEPSMP
jgi:hypothetical protein